MKVVHLSVILSALLFACGPSGHLQNEGSFEEIPGEEVGIEDLGTSEAPLSTTLFSKTATWRYLANGNDPGTAWRGLSFDDSAWKSGAAPLGYGDPDLTTRIASVASDGDKIMAAYFRRAFQIDNPQWVTQLQLALRRDDGAVVYLNGTEVLRSGMPSGTIVYSTEASQTVAGTGETTYVTHTLALGALRAGANVLAVEIHQASAGRSDLVFTAGLTAELTTTETAPGTCVAANSYAAPVVAGTVSTSLITEASGLASSRKTSNVIFTHNDSGGDPEFFALNMSAGLIGTFKVSNAIARDWEDMAVGPCPHGTCVFIAAIGDNQRVRTSYSASVTVSATRGGVDLILTLAGLPCRVLCSSG